MIETLHKGDPMKQYYVFIEPLYRGTCKTCGTVIQCSKEDAHGEMLLATMYYTVMCTVCAWRGVDVYPAGDGYDIHPDLSHLPWVKDGDKVANPPTRSLKSRIKKYFQ